MSLLTALHAARRGVSVATEGINVVGHNTANATTEGYSRRTMSVATMYPLYRNGSWLGQGPGSSSFNRMANYFVDQNLISTVGQQSAAKESFESLRLIEGSLSDGTDGSIVQSFQNFMESLKSLTIDPDDPVLQDQTVRIAQSFTDNVQSTSQFISSTLYATRSDIENSISTINDKLSTVANLNRRLKAAGGTLSMGDLQDQRDLVIRELAELTGSTVRFKADGQAIVMIDGHVVVQEENSRSLSYYEDSNGDPQLAVSANAGRITITDAIGGKFGGKLSAYDTTSTLLSDLDTWVTTFATAFNTQHQAGFDQSGNTSLDFFSFSTVSAAGSLSIDANLLADTSRIAGAAAVNAVTGFPDAGDRGNLDLLIDLENSQVYGSNSSYTARQQLTSMYAGLAREVNDAASDYEMEAMRLEDIDELRSSISGVNLDEEAVKLMQYQASYQAAAKVISVTNRLLGEIMEIV
jgi:flagellar hook-associated protein 1 FlgK